MFTIKKVNTYMGRKTFSLPEPNQSSAFFVK